jgi:hypothetical protein
LAVNTSCVKGVSWFKRDMKWLVRIGVNEKQIHIGYYDNIEDAIQARQTFCVILL